MTNQNQLEIARRYISGKVERLVSVTQRAEYLHSHIESLRQDVASDIIDGWTTGDKLLDFVLLACNGYYNTHVFLVQYHRLFDLALRNPGQRILVVQEAEYWNEDMPIILRNIYLATLRCAEVELNIDTMSIGLPVEPKYFLWREFILNGYILSGGKIIDSKQLYTGPLYNQYCEISICENDENGAIHVPTGTICDIILLHNTDTAELSQEHGIDAKMLNYLHREWIRAKSL